MVDCSFDYFVRWLDKSSLPGDAHASGPFDNRCDFSLGDLGVDCEGTHKCENVTSGAVVNPTGHRFSAACFSILQMSGFSTPFLSL